MQLGNLLNIIIISACIFGLQFENVESTPTLASFISPTPATVSRFSTQIVQIPSSSVSAPISSIIFPTPSLVATSISSIITATPSISVPSSIPPSSTVVFPSISVPSSIPPSSTVVSSSILPTPTPTPVPVVPRLTLSVTSIQLSDRSTDEQVVQCFLNNSPQPGLTPFWVDQNRQVVSTNQMLTVSFSLFPSSMQFFCLANISSSTIEIGLNYTVLVTDSVIEEILNVNSEVSGSEAVDLSEQLSAIANGDLSVDQTNQLLDAVVNVLSFTNTSTLTDETAGELTLAILNTVSSISTRTNNGPATNTNSQENIGNNIASTLSTLVDVINMLPVSFANPIIQVASDRSMLSSQIFSSVDTAVPIQMGSVTITAPPSLFQSFSGPTRITTLVSNSLNSFPAMLGGSETASIAGSVNSLSIQGINGNDVIDPPINITSTVSGVPAGRVLVCSFWNVTSQSWESTGVITVLGGEDDEVACLASHLTSFSVLSVTRESESSAANLPLKIVSYILLSLSLIALLISLILFILSGKLFIEVEMNRVYLNFAVALTLGIFGFIFGSGLGVLNQVWCILITIFLHYFWLSVFTWGLGIAIILAYLVMMDTFSKLLKLQHLFWVLFVLAWTIPIPIVIITMIAGLVRGNYVRIDGVCFLANEYIWSLIGPITVLILLSTVGLTIAILKVVQSLLKKNTSESSDFNKIKLSLIAFCILLPTLGIPWILILVDFIFNVTNQPSLAFVWVFLILISPSGVIFFIAFTLPNQEVRDTLIEKLCGIPKSVESLPGGNTAAKSPTRSITSRAKTNDYELEGSPRRARNVIFSNRSVTADDGMLESLHEDTNGGDPNAFETAT